MDTQQRFGLAKPKALALFLQLILIVLATASTAFILWFSIAFQAGWLFITGYAAVLIAYAAIIFYAAYGYRQKEAYYLGAVYAFCAAILCNVILPFRTTYQVVVLTVLFGLYIAFAQRLRQPKIADRLLAVTAVCAAAFSVYSTLTARVDNLGPFSQNLFSVTAMYLSIWTPVIMTVTLGLCYSLRRD